MCSLDRFLPARRLQVVRGDCLPANLPARNIVVARDDEEDWCVGFRCPCGCDRTIELLIIPEANPRWDLISDERNRVTLSPSVWLKDGCESHFFLRRGRIQWCK
ncbi:DUF6527 family protein [Cupriavidus pauculus]|uniref:DUF6527 family protein n=1 Tax=Cupriavidus pauculus TaxID=82633 RepID=UPI000A012B7D|nr:DUF6527 family protein [Cupriavidus pauculus]